MDVDSESGTEREMCFSIAGKDLTRIARGRLLEDPGHAYRILATALIGEGAQDAVLAILRGEKKLTGDSRVGVKLVKERPSADLTRWIANVRYVYAGRFRHYGRWLRPVAVVTVVGPEDADYANERASQGDKPAWGRERARFYTKVGGDVWSLKLPGDVGDDRSEAYVIFEPCSERPHWENPPLTPQEALDEAVASGRGLETRGYVAEPRRGDAVDVDDVELDDDADDEEDDSAAVRQAKRDERDEARWQAYLAEAKRIGEKVREQAGDDTFQMPLSDGRVLTVPRAPFVHWALERTEHRDTAPPWELVSRSGFKCELDSPAHTDWWLGAGLDIEDYRICISTEDPLGNAVMEKMFELQQSARDAARPKPKFAGIFAVLDSVRSTRHKAAVIIDNGERTGVVGVDIAVLPDSLESRASEVASSIGVIVEQGGPLAHIAIVSRANGLTMMRCAKACEIFKPGMTVTLNPATGRITVVGGATEGSSTDE